MKLFLVFMLGLFLGFFMVLLLPAILTAFLVDWWTRLVGTPLPHRVRCDGDTIRWETVQANGRTVELFRWL